GSYQACAAERGGGEKPSLRTTERLGSSLCMASRMASVSGFLRSAPISFCSVYWMSEGWERKARTMATHLANMKRWANLSASDLGFRKRTPGEAMESSLLVEEAMAPMASLPAP